eukprot:7963062-Alexandrium_andersonii.AAC.1
MGWAWPIIARGFACAWPNPGRRRGRLRVGRRSAAPRRRSVAVERLGDGRRGPVVWGAVMVYMGENVA